jgi:hypothetical protein
VGLKRIDIITWQLKTGTVGTEKSSIARQQAVNTFAWQTKQVTTSTIPRPSLGNSLLNMSHSNGGILGSSILCVVHIKAIW